MTNEPDSPPLTPLGEAIRRLRGQIYGQHHVLVSSTDIETLLDALQEAERVVPWDRGGESG